MYPKSKTPYCLIAVFVFLFSSISFAQNQLKNGGFEDKSGWNFSGGEITSEVKRTGKSSMKVSNAAPAWTGADQSILLPEGVKTIEVSGYMKTDNIVKGANSWEMARLAVEFYNEGGSQVGGYALVTGQQAGTSDWTLYKQSYSPPSGAATVKIQAIFGNCTGTAWYDDIEVILKNESGGIMERKLITGPMDEGNWYEITVDAQSDGSHYVDWSSLLDAPAGKHGFIKVVDGGHLQFEDGTPAKFWGTNLVASACFPSKEKADSLASRLSKMGCNLIRLHHMDAPWSNPNLFCNKDNTRQICPQSLDKLDYLIAALKKKGIYIFMDLLVHRDFMASDGVKNKPPDLGGKQVGYLDRKLIDLQKEFAQQLLTHKNKYTKLTYVEDPAILASEFINESSAFLHFSGDILTDAYRKPLEAEFAAEYPGKKLCTFDVDYSFGVSPRMVRRSGTGGDAEESIRFIAKKEAAYYSEMNTFLRSLGVKYLLSGSNMPFPLLAYQKNNTALDLIIANDYWDHPQLWKISGDWSKILYAPINNTSLIRNPDKSLINNITKFRWHQKPFMVTEYNACYPNEYIMEAIPFVAAYTSLQGIDGMMQFDFGINALGADRMSPFTLASLPDHLAQWVVGAPMFLRGDIQTAKGLVLEQVKEEQIFSLPNYSDFLDNNFHLTYITKVAKVYGSIKADDPSEYASYYNEAEKIIRSETGELTLNAIKGTLQINAPKVQGVTGGLNSEVFDLPFMKIKVNNSWASVIAVSKDNKPLSESQNFYLVVVGPARMKDQKYNEDRSALLNPGKFPILAQVIEGEVIIKTKKDVKITPLSPSGKAGQTFSASAKDGGMVIDLSKGRTFVYEVKLK